MEANPGSPGYLLPETGEAPSGSVLWMVAGCLLMAFGNARNDGAYTATALIFVLFGVAVLLLGLLPTGARAAWRYESLAAVATIAVAGFVALYHPAGVYGSGPSLSLARFFSVVAVAVAGTGAVLQRILRRSRGLWCAGAVTVALVAAVLMIVASPRPAIDVWYMDQAATTALLHGHNFYSAHWTSGIAGEVSNRFVYLPGIVILQAPFKLLFGDVRFAIVAAFAVTVYCVFRLTSRPTAWVLASSIVLLPKMTFGVEQAWTDPLLVALTVAMVLAVRSGHPRLGILAFAVALSCKQYSWLFIPPAAVWPAFGLKRTALSVGGASIVIAPWVATDPAAFWRGSVSYNLHLAARPDSLSLYSLALRHGISPGYSLIVGGALVGVVLSMWLARAGASGFLLGAGLTMIAFDLVSKQAFFNEWFLGISLALAGIAIQPADAALERPPLRFWKARPDPPATSSTVDAGLGFTI